MRRPGLHRRLRGRPGLSGFAPSSIAIALLDWSTDISTTRASEATHFDAATETLTRYSNGTARVLSDGTLYVEGERFNRLRFSRVYWTGSALSWDAGSGSFTVNATTAPDGDADATEITGTGVDGPFSNVNSTERLTAGSGCVISCFLKRVTTDGSVKIGCDLYSAGTDVAVNFGSTWTRETVNLLVDSGTGLFGTMSDATANCYVWGWQLEDEDFPSQLIDTDGATATRLADDITIAAADVPATMLYGAWTFTIAPARSSDDDADTSTETIFAFATGTDDRIYLDDSTGQIVVRVGGSNVVSSSALTWSRGQTMTVTVDAVAGTINVSGATTGDGEQSGTAWYFPAGDDVQVGNDSALATAFFGAIGAPTTTSTTLTLPTTNLLMALDARVGVTEGATFTWADQSGNSNDATQTVGANQPSVETHGTFGTVVRFDDSGPEFLDVAGPALSGGEYTVHCVIDPTDTGNQDMLISWDSNTPLMNMRRFGSTDMGVYDGSVYRGIVAGADGAQHIRFTISDSANTVQIHRNGSQIVSAAWNLTTTSAGASVRIGIDSAETAGNALEADIAFLAVYENSDANQAAAVQAYIEQEWPLS
jgi:hypothetical protein